MLEKVKKTTTRKQIIAPIFIGISNKISSAIAPPISSANAVAMKSYEIN